MEAALETKQDTIQPTMFLFNKEMLVKQKVFYIKKIITIEPIVCFSLLATSIRELVLNNLLLEMSCRANKGYNDTVCATIVSATHEINNFTRQNSIIQEHINAILGWCIPIQSIIPVILLLFMGTYSDIHRIRKPFLLIPMFGETFSTACCIACAIFSQKWPVEAAGSAQYIVPAFFGSYPLLNMACFAYIADVSSPQTRIVRMTVLQICMNIGKPIGMLFGGVLFERVGYIPSLAVGVFFLMSASLYGICMVDESKRPSEIVVKIKIADHALDAVKMITKARGRSRTNILFILVIYFITITVFAGEGNVCFWFTQQTYGWRNTDFAFFQAIRSIVNSVALTLAVPVFSKVFKMHDLVIIILSFVNKIISNIICMTVKTSTGLYAGTIVGMLAMVATTGIRSQSTKYVSEDEHGKMQSLLSIAEAIAVSLAAQIYNLGLYSITRDIYGQAFFAVGIVLYVFGLILITTKYLNEKKNGKTQISDICTY